MNLRKLLCVFLSVLFISAALVGTAAAQGRQRIVSTGSSKPINQPVNPQNNPTNSSNPVKKTVSSQPINQPPTQRPTLTNEIKVANNNQNQPPLIQKTASTQPTNAATAKTGALNYSYSPIASRLVYTANSNQGILGGIQKRLGLRYVYGSTGPNTYDCSGFVWSVFNDAGIYFERSSAKTFWANFEPVYGDDRFKFGTLVFFNRLGHVGIVVDDKGFYHASSSKGITYSKFEGYWGKRIVGFRRVPLNLASNNLNSK